MYVCICALHNQTYYCSFQEAHKTPDMCMYSSRLAPSSALRCSQRDSCRLHRKSCSNSPSRNIALIHLSIQGDKLYILTKSNNVCVCSYNVIYMLLECCQSLRDVNKMYALVLLYYKLSTYTQVYKYNCL